MPVLAPKDAAEAVALIADAFELADRWRTPVLVFGDYYLAHTAQSVDVPEPGTPPAPPEWALDGRTGGTGHAKLLSPLGSSKRRDDVGYDLQAHYHACAAAVDEMTAGIEPRAEVADTDDAEVVVVAWGTPGRYVRAAVRELRAEGHKIGFMRPITLYPFPTETLVAAAQGAKVVAVYENNQGQMIDDVRLALDGRVPVRFIGGLSLDHSGFGIAPDLEVATLRARIEEVATC
jgi:2-oxoglutarate ferredoxin oxidoreductase subunit alpha